MKSRLTLLILLLATAFGASGQPATPAQRVGVEAKADYATLHLRTKLGSFRMIDGQGRVEIQFTGTLLVSQLKGNIGITGQVKKEFDKEGRQVWFGTGRAIITGSFRAIQWFGRNMQAVWFGKGVCQIVGEFDKDLNTGEYWFDDPKDRMAWSASTLMTIVLPRPSAMPNVQPRERGTPPPKPQG
ncbi:MAG TPA: hypothetical protein PLH94_11810 [Fimbriimonadaceae bacterium]|nr:hypothetical protein [Fimbriimonadaceae bacterium]